MNKVEGAMEGWNRQEKAVRKAYIRKSLFSNAKPYSLKGPPPRSYDIMKKCQPALARWIRDLEANDRWKEFFGMFPPTLP